MSRTNDGLDTSSTTDAYSDRGAGHSNRTYDGLDASNTTDASSRGQSGGNYRGNDGLDAVGTSDAYGSSAGRNAAGAYRDNDGLDAGGTTDAAYGTGKTRGGDPSYTGTSGGLGYDDRIGDNSRTGGAERGGDQELSEGTSGGLGQNDTYGDEADTGGADTGFDHNFGMGTGRTISQEKAGPLPTEPGRVDVQRDEERELENRHRGPDDPYPDDSKKDSTMGKLMEKAGGAFHNKNLQQKGEQKRMDAATS